jgi:hypothetical protein
VRGRASQYGRFSRWTCPTGERDTTYTGKKIQGFDRLDSERDPFSRAFNTATNDKGLPGDIVDVLNAVIDTIPGAPLTLLSEEEQMFQQSVRDFAVEKIRPLVHQMDHDAAMSKDLIQSFFELGIMGIEVPDQFGGAGSTFFNAVLVVEEPPEPPALEVEVEVVLEPPEPPASEPVSGAGSSPLSPHAAERTITLTIGKYRSKACMANTP